MSCVPVDPTIPKPNTGDLLKEAASGDVPVAPVVDTRRPGTRNRIRRLMHPHHSTVVRVALITGAVIVALVIVGGSIRSLGADDAPSVDPASIDRLDPAWTTDLGFGPISGLAIEGDLVYASTDQALAAFRTSCQITAEDACRPEWTDAVPDGPLSAPTVFEDRVYAGSARGLVYAFPADCTAKGCEPEWTGVAGRGPVSQPGANEDFLYVTSDRLYAFPAACGTEDRPCPPAWSAAVPGRASRGAPALGGGFVVVTSPSATGGVFAFPAVCSARCEPVWTGITDGPATTPAIEGDTVFVVARGRLLAFPLTCEGECRPTWTGTFAPGGGFAPGAASAPVPAGDHVYVGADDGALWRFPASCPRSSCAPSAAFAMGRLPLSAPVNASGLTFVTSRDGTLHAVADDCDPGDACAEGLVAFLGASTSASAVAGTASVYAGDDDGRVHAYTLRTGPPGAAS